MSLKSGSTIGLDIGSYSVKYVEMSHDKQGIQLHQAKLVTVPNPSAESLKALLRTLMPPVPPVVKRVRISMSGQSLLIRRIKLPLMTPVELKGAIRYEAESHIPFPIDDCVLDFQILNRAASEKTMSVLLVAAKRDFIMERLKVLEESGLRAELIDVDIFCLSNSFEMLSKQEESRVYGLLNIGHRVSSFMIVQDKSPYFVREIAFGGADVTKALMALKVLPENEADQLKKSKLPDQQDELQMATQRGFEPLVEELRHSVDYFENEAGEELSNVYLSGGGALSAGVSEFLSQELGKKVARWDNTSKMEVFQNIERQFIEEHSLEFNVAFGMVLRGLQYA